LHFDHETLLNGILIMNLY